MEPQPSCGKRTGVYVMKNRQTIDERLTNLRGERKRAVSRLLSHLTYGISIQVLVKALGPRNYRKIFSNLIILTTLMESLAENKGRF